MLRPSRWFGWSKNASANSGGGLGPSGSSPSSAELRNAADNPHSLQQLKNLCTLLEKNQTVTESNRTLLVETLRQIAEILIWGDQNDSSVFDFFLEKNMLDFFLRIMKQNCGGYVCTQLLQTLNILFENIKHETSLYYLLSNNHVNSIIMHRFDFEDEEVMAYYVSFLKTLSLKLNNHTIHFFFNEHTADFPLYTEAIKFFHHPEKMVRIAVRTLTLNVFAVREEAMLRFIRDCTAAPYFSSLSWFIGSHVMDIERALLNFIINANSGQPSSEMGQKNLIIKLEDLVAEHLDHLHYLNDILRLKVADLNLVLTDNLLHRFIVPLYLHSFLGFVSHERWLDVFTADGEKDGSNNAASILSPAVALYLLTQAFLIFSYGPLCQSLVTILFDTNQAGVEQCLSRCDFTRPAKSLQDAIEQAIVSSNFVTSNSIASDSSSSSTMAQIATEALQNRSKAETSSIPSGSNQPNAIPPKLVVNIVDTNDEESVDAGKIMSTTTTTSCEPSTPCSPMPLYAPSLSSGGKIELSERPFLIAILAALNINVVSRSPSSALLNGEEDSPQAKKSNLKQPTVDNAKTLKPKPDTEPLSIEGVIIPRINFTSDRIVLFSLSLLQSILSNRQIPPEQYRGILMPFEGDDTNNQICAELVTSLLHIVRQCCDPDSLVCLVTFELAVYLFRRVVFSLAKSSGRVNKASADDQDTTAAAAATSTMDDGNSRRGRLFLTDYQYALLEQASEYASHLVRQLYRKTDESLFLELFENEADLMAAMMAETNEAGNAHDNNSQQSSFSSSSTQKIWSHNLRMNVEHLFMDAMLLLPAKDVAPTNSEANFSLRLPVNDLEKTKYAIKVFFVLRRLVFDIERWQNNVDSSGGDAQQQQQQQQPGSNNIKRPFDLTPLLASSNNNIIGGGAETLALDKYLDLENTEMTSTYVKFCPPLFGKSRSYEPSSNTRRAGASSVRYSAPGSRSESPHSLPHNRSHGQERRAQYFMVITPEMLVLIQPDCKRVGCGVIRFLARLQDIEILPNSYAISQVALAMSTSMVGHTFGGLPPMLEKLRDNTTLYIFFRRYQMSTTMANDAAAHLMPVDGGTASTASHRRPSNLYMSTSTGGGGGLAPGNSIIACFNFDDSIRYNTTFKHLSKMQSKVRDRKFSAIMRLIESEPTRTSTSAAATSAGSIQQAEDALTSSTIIYNRKPEAAQAANNSRKSALPGSAVPSSSNELGVSSSSASLDKTEALLKLMNKKKYAYPTGQTTTTRSAATSSTSGRASKNVPASAASSTTTTTNIVNKTTSRKFVRKVKNADNNVAGHMQHEAMELLDALPLVPLNNTTDSMATTSAATAAPAASNNKTDAKANHKDNSIEHIV